MKLLKFLVVLSSGFALLVPGMIAAAPSEVPEARISPRARTVLERIDAAYSAVDGWTASIRSEVQTVTNGAQGSVIYKTTERYVRSSGLTGYYSSADYSDDGVPIALTWQDATAQYLIYAPATGKLTRPPVGTTSSPDESKQPRALIGLRAQLGRAQFVRYAGKESLAGQSCDVLEFVSIQWPPDPAAGPKQPSGVSTNRFYVDPAGFIVRTTYFNDSPSESDAGWVDQRITYDAAAKLTAADFSRENFEREAAPVLQGQPMPEFEQELFARGGHLPDASFIAWSDKKPFRISDLKGKVVVIETWASWCQPCKEAFPFYEKIRQKIAAQDVVFVAVSFDEKLANYEKWMNERGGAYGFKFGRIDAQDPKKALKDFKGSLPAFYVLGRDGLIISSYIGYGYGPAGEDPRLLAALREAGIEI